MREVDETGKVNNSVTKRVDERLIRGDYEDYDQISKEEGTTTSFIAKRAHQLKNEGRLHGDRRSKGKGQTNGNEGSSGNASDKIHTERMKAYRLLGVPEEDLKIMEEGHIDLQGLRKMKVDVRALVHDKLTEQVAKEFSNVAQLRDFMEFYRAVRSTGATYSQYQSVMSKIGQLLYLDQYILGQTDDVSRLHSEVFGLRVQASDVNRQLVMNKAQNAALLTNNRVLETKYNELLQSFRDVAEGKRYSEEVHNLVRREYDKVLKGDSKWSNLVQFVAYAASRYPIEFEELAQAFRAGDIKYINAHAERLGLPLLEAQQLFRKDLELEATEALRKQILDSIQPPRAFQISGSRQDLNKR